MMRTKYLFLLVYLLCFSLIACQSDEAKVLKARLEAPLSVQAKPILGRYSTEALAKLYRDQELAMNHAFVQQLETSANEAFERQLAAFEDEELGFFEDYFNMLAYVFKSDEQLKEEWKLKSGKYFSELRAQAGLPVQASRYTREVNQLRNQFQKGLQSAPEVDVTQQHVAMPQVDLSGMVTHTRNNLVFELGEEVLSYFGIPVLIILVLGALGMSIGEGTAGILALILTLILGIWASMWNDSKVIDGLRTQYKQQSVSYRNLQQQLDEQTYKTYEEWIK